MAKLSDPQIKALRYLLWVERHGAVSPEIYEEFDRYSPKGQTLDSLARKGLITDLVVDEHGMPEEPHTLTRTGYIRLAYDVFGSKDEGAFAQARLNEINEKTRAQQEKNRDLKARAESIARSRYGVSYTVQQAREIETQLRREEAVIQSATPIEEVPPTAAEVVERIDEIAKNIVSAMTGLSPDEIGKRVSQIDGFEIPEDLDGPVTGFGDDGIRTFNSFEELFESLRKSVPVELPPLPEPRCGDVLDEEIQCTRDPGHEGEKHGYSPGYGLDELTWDREGKSALNAAPSHVRTGTLRDIRRGRDEAIMHKEEELQRIASGDTWVANCTERARKCYEIAQEVCELNGFDPDDVLHAHDGGETLQICTLLPPSASVERFALAAGQRIGIELGWVEGIASAQVAPSTGTIGILVQKHALP